MSEWWTYQASDFLMFSPPIYWRLFGSLNQAFWPIQPLLVFGALAWLSRIAFCDPSHRSRWLARSGAVALALCWLLVAWAFLWQRFAPINWIAGDFAWAFAVHGLLLLVASGAGVEPAASASGRRTAGLALGVWALLGHPLLGLVFGRDLMQAEVFGLAPDPTAAATLAWLLLVASGGSILSRWLLRALWILPLLWCLASAAMFRAMADWQGWVMLAVAAIAVAAALAPDRAIKPANSVR